MKNWEKWKWILISFLSVIVLCGVLALGISLGLKHKTIIVHCDLDDTEIISDETNRYSEILPNLPTEIGNYIIALSNELQIDSDLVISHLLVENPTFNINAIHKNENGTIDVGLFQLNDRYVYTSFVPKFWDFDDVEFDPFNWKHNTFIACHLIQSLQEQFKVMEDGICAYNCGNGNVMNNTIPESAIRYKNSVMNNYNMLKNENK